MALVTALFDRAGEAREWSEAEDIDLTVTTLARNRWLEAWDQGVQTVSERTVAALNKRFELAAAESRMPRRFRRRLPLTADEARALAARLSAGDAPFRHAVEELERAGARVRSARADSAALTIWSEAVRTAARRLEAAWLALEESLTLAWTEWGAEIERVRTWQRPVWPLLLTAVLLLVAATYAGLLLGGYLPVPAPLEQPVQWWWSR
jgi:hypothetical protein